MTKTKRQLREEAVERLKANPSDDTFEKIIAAAIGCTPLFITTRQTRDMLIDLLTDDASDDSAPEKVVSDGDVDVTTEKRSKTEHDGVDSREKLEADIWYFIEHNGWFGYEYEAESYADCRKAIFEIFKEWLDRQAAITKRECESTFLDRADKVITRRELEKRELQVKVDNLDRELAAARKAHAQAEHEAIVYRMKLGRALDHAHEIERLAD